jgi:hypothetical protein
VEATDLTAKLDLLEPIVERRSVGGAMLGPSCSLVHDERAGAAKTQTGVPTGDDDPQPERRAAWARTRAPTTGSSSIRRPAPGAPIS